jgi:hypothetical protein
MGGMKGMPGWNARIFILRFKDSCIGYFKPFLNKQTTTKP